MFQCIFSVMAKNAHTSVSNTYYRWRQQQYKIWHTLEGSFHCTQRQPDKPHSQSCFKCYTILTPDNLTFQYSIPYIISEFFVSQIILRGRLSLWSTLVHVSFIRMTFDLTTVQRQQKGNICIVSTAFKVRTFLSVRNRQTDGQSATCNLVFYRGRAW